MQRIAALEPATVWLGHYGPMTDGAAELLEAAAARA
jgi:hypothetical protein